MSLTYVPSNGRGYDRRIYIYWLLSNINRNKENVGAES